MEAIGPGISKKLGKWAEEHTKPQKAPVTSEKSVNYEGDYALQESFGAGFAALQTKWYVATLASQRQLDPDVLVKEQQAYGRSKLRRLNRGLFGRVTRCVLCGSVAHVGC